MLLAQRLADIDRRFEFLFRQFVQGCADVFIRAHFRRAFYQCRAAFVAG